MEPAADAEVTPQSPNEQARIYWQGRMLELGFALPFEESIFLELLAEDGLPVVGDEAMALEDLKGDLEQKGVNVSSLSDRKLQRMLGWINAPCLVNEPHLIFTSEAAPTPAGNPLTFTMSVARGCAPATYTVEWRHNKQVYKTSMSNSRKLSLEIEVANLQHSGMWDACVVDSTGVRITSTPWPVFVIQEQGEPDTGLGCWINWLNNWEVRPIYTFEANKHLFHFLDLNIRILFPLYEPNFLHDDEHGYIIMRELPRESGGVNTKSVTSVYTVKQMDDDIHNPLSFKLLVARNMLSTHPYSERMLGYVCKLLNIDSGDGPVGPEVVAEHYDRFCRVRVADIQATEAEAEAEATTTPARATANATTDAAIGCNEMRLSKTRAVPTPLVEHGLYVEFTPTQASAGHYARIGVQSIGMSAAITLVVELARSWGTQRPWHELFCSAAYAGGGAGVLALALNSAGTIARVYPQTQMAIAARSLMSYADVYASGAVVSCTLIYNVYKHGWTMRALRESMPQVGMSAGGLAACSAATWVMGAAAAATPIGLVFVVGFGILGGLAAAHGTQQLMHPIDAHRLCDKEMRIDSVMLGIAVLSPDINRVDDINKRLRTMRTYVHPDKSDQSMPEGVKKLTTVMSQIGTAAERLLKHCRSVPISNEQEKKKPEKPRAIKFWPF